MKLIITLLLSFVVLHAPKTVWGQFSLWLVEKKVALKYQVPEVDHMELKAILDSEDASQYIIFDTRAWEEYDTSHIPTALHLDPAIEASDFIRIHGKDLRGKHLIFYCSVGDRSSNLVERVADAAGEAGALSLSNLRGGIFRWYNEDNVVVDENGVTDAIHPYDENWGALIEKRRHP
jgi:rhodanese-related sulfurtransferase